MRNSALSFLPSRSMPSLSQEKSVAFRSEALSVLSSARKNSEGFLGRLCSAAGSAQTSS